jgi:hypothetical protein
MFTGQRRRGYDPGFLGKLGFFEDVDDFDAPLFGIDERLHALKILLRPTRAG